MIDIKKTDKAEKFREYSTEKSTKLNVILGGILVVSMILYFVFIKPSSDPSIIDRIKNDTNKINSSIEDFKTFKDSALHKL